MNLNLLSFLLVSVLLAFGLMTSVEKGGAENPEFSYQPQSQYTAVIANAPRATIGYTQAAGAVGEPEETVSVDPINASVALVKELSSDEFLYQHNGAQRWPLASVTKLMTAVVAVENIGAQTPVVISAEAIATEGPQGYFVVGETFTVQDLIKSMMVVSSNDAAVALSEMLTEDRFVSTMNAKAAALKMTSTNFIEPTGLSIANQSTAFDIGKLITYIYNYHPEILSYSRKPEVDIINLNNGAKRTLENINSFAGESYFLGGKTGYTDDANGNLVSLFYSNNEPLLVVVFGTNQRFNDTQKLWKQFKQ